MSTPPPASLRSLFLAVLAGVTPWVAGCQEPKQRITMLEESNQKLLDDLQAAYDEMETLRFTGDECQQQLASSRMELSQVSQRLAAAQNRPPVQVQSPPREIVIEKPVPQGWVKVPGGAMIAIEGSVLFDSGKTKLRKGAVSTLGRVASELSGQYASKDILVFGHTDNQPIKKSGWMDNYELSTQRSLAVVRWLSKNGVSPKRLVACGCGEHRPRVPNTSSGNRRTNRRVEIFALDAEMKVAGR